MRLIDCRVGLCAAAVAVSSASAQSARNTTSPRWNGTHMFWGDYILRIREGPFSALQRNAVVRTKCGV